HPVDAPHAAWIFAPAAPRVDEVPLEVVAEDLVRALIRRPQLAVARDDEAVDVHRRPRTEGPLVEILAVLVEDLHAPVGAVVDVDAARRGIHRDAVDAVEVTRPLLVRRRPLLPPLHQLLA